MENKSLVDVLFEQIKYSKQFGFDAYIELNSDPVKEIPCTLLFNFNDKTVDVAFRKCTLTLPVKKSNVHLFENYIELTIPITIENTKNKFIDGLVKFSFKNLYL